MQFASLPQPLTISLKKGAKALRDTSQAAAVWTLKGVGVRNFPVPPNSLMRTTSNKSIRGFWESGLTTYLPIATCALHGGVDLLGEGRILDFGCGVGRQLLHFTRHFPAPEYYACDVSGPCVDYVGSAFPTVHACRNEFRPPLAYANEQFDMVYSVSVFSHLAPEDHDAWLVELARVVKHGGFCFLTVEGPTALRQINSLLPPKDRSWVEADLANAGALFQEYGDLEAERAHARWVRFGSKYSGVRGSYGTTLMTPAYVKSHWTATELEVLDILEGVVDRRQDLVVLRRR